MRSAQWNVQYTQRFLELDPIALWALDDKVLPTAWDSSRNWRNGVHSNVQLMQPGMGDGGTSCLYVPGSLSRTDVFSPSLQTAFNPSAGSVVLWARNLDWITAVNYIVFSLYADANNEILMYTAPSDIVFYFSGGGVVKQVTYNIPSAPAGFFMWTITWDTADMMRMYYNDTEVGIPKVVPAWVGNLLYAAIGVRQTGVAAFASYWTGNVALPTFFDRALSPAEIADKYRIQ